MTSVLQVSTFYSDLGGVEKAVSDLATGLCEKHFVRVLCTHKAARTQSEIRRGVHVISVGGAVAIEGRPLALSFPLRLREQELDIAHYHLPCPLAMVSHILSPPRAKVNVATWHHDLVRHPTLNRAMRPFLEKFLDSLDKIIVTAPALIEHTEVLSKRRHKCQVVPLGIDHRRFVERDSEAVESLRKRFDKPIVLFVGRLVYYKGCEVLIRAMTSVDAHLLIVGDGPERQAFEKLRDHLGLTERVHFLGRLADDELKNAYLACDVFTLPSTLSTECFGLVQVEAMMCEKPVVNTQLPTGTPWVSLHGETGLTVPPGSVYDLGQALQTLIADAELRRRFGQNALQRAHQMFTLDAHVDAVSELYEELLMSRHNKDTKDTGNDKSLSRSHCVVSNAAQN